MGSLHKSASGSDRSDRDWLLGFRKEIDLPDLEVSVVEGPGLALPF